MKEIELTQGKRAIVDDEDYGRLMLYKWYAMQNFNTFYATRGFYPIGEKGKRITIQMHRVILNLSFGDGKLVDHKDRNGLHNWRDNLRIASPCLSVCNREIQKNNISGYRGVSWDKHNKKWLSLIGINGKQKNLGRFVNPISAALAYDETAVEYYGQDAILNFPERGVL